MLRYLSVVALAVVSFACHPDGLFLHLCEQTAASGGWDYRQLILEHNEPRTCPTSIYPGIRLNFSGVVTDDPPFDFAEGQALVQNLSQYQIKVSQIYLFRFDSNNRWSFEVNLQYEAATGSNKCMDTGIYEMLTTFNGAPTGRTPWARLNFTYSYLGGNPDCSDPGGGESNIVTRRSPSGP